MPTRVVTTNPAGHTVSIFAEELTAYQVADIYHDYYGAIETWHIEDTIPDGWFMRCSQPKNSPDWTGEPILYQIKWTVIE